MHDLENQVAIVTGGAAGIGYGCARKLQIAGASVIIADINLKAAQDSAGKLGSRTHAIELDVTDPDSARNLVELTLSRFEKIDILVNNAGVGPRLAPIQELSDEEFERVMSINVTGTFNSTRAVVPTLISQGSGRIINISSIMGQTGAPNACHYTASKHAVIGLTRALAHELAKYDVTVNAICPGVIATELHTAVVKGISASQGTAEDSTWEWFREQIPLGRFQTPDDIGELVAFLASTRAKNITGTQIGVDGGWAMH
ncbi:SDR family NAD(P)-dependent oxidoreductase [Nocardia sp. NPDC003183]